MNKTHSAPAQINTKELKKSPLISVIVPVYNVEKYIDKCLTSIRQQTLTNIEIICVNDCSPDDSWEIVKRHASEDDRFVLLEHEVNSGQGIARNTGIAAARAKFVGGVDSDDYINCDMFETLWSASNQGEIDVVCCGYKVVGEDGRELSKQSFSANDFDLDLEPQDIFNIINPAFWNKIWRKSIIEDYHIEFPSLKHCEDTVFTAKVLASSNKLKIIDENLYSYVSRGASITHGYTNKHLIDVFSSYQIMYEFLIDKGLWNKFGGKFYAHVVQNTLYEFNLLRKANISKQEKLRLGKSFAFLKTGFLSLHENLDVKDIEDLLIEN